MDVRVERVDLGRVVSEVRDVLRGLASAKQLEIDAVIDRDTSSVVADPGRLKQILYNYLSNAIKFTPAGGQIHIRVGPESGALFRLEVEDTGVGIASEHLNRLFIEFQQLDSGSAKAYPGTGLGLALTKRLVEALGGRVEVRSAVGEGSTFAAVLPRVMSSGQAEPWPRPTIPVVRPTPRIPLNRTVLIVEDDAAAARMAETTLRQHGFEPMTRSNGFEALHAAVMNMPAFIVVDLLMPGVDGFELIARLRQSPGGRLLPIIVWTVKDLTREERQLLQGAGATIVAKGEGGAEPLVEELQRLQREGAGG